MPIGKNAIKRVENNGYSNVQTSAPDMENSVVLAEGERPAKRAPAALLSPCNLPRPADSPQTHRKFAGNLERSRSCASWGNVIG